MDELREKIARELCAEKGGIDPDGPQLGGTAKVWESFLPAADRILALPEIAELLKLKLVKTSANTIGQTRG